MVAKTVDEQDWFDIEIRRQEQRAETAGAAATKAMHETILRCMVLARAGGGKRRQPSLFPVTKHKPKAKEVK